MDRLLVYVLMTVLIAMCIENADLIYSRNDLYGNGTAKLHRQVLSAEFIMSTLAELVLFAFSSNEILEASAAIGEAAYRCEWYKLPCDENGRALRQGLTIMVIRSYKPCLLTVGKICPMTLQVFKSALSTALSYITVLRGMKEN